MTLLEAIMKLRAAVAVVFLLVPVLFAQNYPYSPNQRVAVDSSTLRQTELDFAKAFADRNPARFAEFIADEARFTSAGKLRDGKSAIVAHWTKMMQDPNLTVIWSPDIAQVSEAGDLGYTSGPYEVWVKRPDGSMARERGRFASVWRRGPDGKYRIVFDIGSPEEPPPPKS